MNILSMLAARLGLGRPKAPDAPAPAAAGAVPVLAVGDPAPARPAPARTDAPAVLRGPAVGLTPRDMERLRGVHPDLVRVVVRARSMVPFLVAEGVRSVEKQRAEIRAGRSKIPLDRAHTGRHVTGHAVDLYPISTTPIPQMKRAEYEPVAKAMERAAALEGVPLTSAHFAWGWDSPHFELPRGYYPA